jgi:hypothetical protein
MAQDSTEQERAIADALAREWTAVDEGLDSLVAALRPVFGGDEQVSTILQMICDAAMAKLQDTDPEALADIATSALQRLPSGRIVIGIEPEGEE